MDKVRFVDSREAAALSGKSPQHLAVLAAAGRIPGVKRVGTVNNGVWLFPVVEGGIVIAPAANPVGRPKRFSPIHARREKQAALSA
jgi:hypothetical protein